MAITRYQPLRLSPWRELGDLSNRLGWFFGEGPGETAWVPAVNVEEGADDLLFRVEVPGVSRDAITVEVKDGLLTVRGEKTEEREEGSEERRYHVWERRFGSFQRTFRLPRTVNAENVEADYRDGVLSIRVPKLPEAKARQIEIGDGA